MSDKPYFPSNGTEGVGFMECFCAECKKDTAFRKENAKTFCPIIGKAMGLGKAPKQWVIRDGNPICTSFVNYKTYKPKTKRLKKGQLQLL